MSDISSRNRADHAKTKDYCMTRFFRHGQSFETPIALSMMKSVKNQFFSNPTGPDFVDFSHMSVSACQKSELYRDIIGESGAF